MRRSDLATYDVFCGIDVGKESHYLVALDRDGDEMLLSEPVAQDEKAIRQALADASVLGERMLVTVDRNGAFGSLVVVVAKDMGLDVAHLPPRKFDQVAESYGEDKTDAKDVFVIADVSRSVPRHIELIGERSEATARINHILSIESLIKVFT